MNTKYLLSGSVVALCAILAACGGGGGGTSGGNPPPTSTPITTPSAVTGSGTLVDHDTGSPLAGIKVGLAPDTAGATPVPQGTTGPNGAFTVSASSPGTYLLVIGNDVYPDPNNRPTIHDLVTLNAGSTPLVAPTIAPIPCGSPNNLNPCTTPSPVEQSSTFRLTTLTSAEQACLQLENTTRQQKSLNPVVSDEWLTEQNRYYWSVATASNSLPYYPGIFVNYNADDGNGADCSDMIAGDFVLGLWPSYPQLQYYAGASGGANHVATSEGMVDPRATPYPSPSPSNPWP